MTVKEIPGAVPYGSGDVICAKCVVFSEKLLAATVALRQNL